MKKEVFQSDRQRYELTWNKDEMWEMCSSLDLKDALRKYLHHDHIDIINIIAADARYHLIVEAWR